MFQKRKANPAAATDDDGWDPEDDARYLGLDESYSFNQQTSRGKGGGSLLVEEEDEEIPTTAQVESGVGADLFAAYDFIAPVANLTASGSLVPYSIQQAARTLAEYPRIPREARAHVALLAQGRPHEFIKHDPQVVLSSTVSTGTCVIVLREVCSVSKYLLLCTFNARYTVQVTPKAKTEPFEFSKVHVCPYYGQEFDEEAQPFGVDAYVDDVMNRNVSEGVDEQLNAYMWSLGVLDAAAFCDPEADVVEMFKKVARGEKQIVRKRVKLSERQIQAPNEKGKEEEGP